MARIFFDALRIFVCTFIVYTALPASCKKLLGNMLIAYEYGCFENIDNKLALDTCNFGATLSLLVTAFYQEAAPILVPAPLWHTLLYHKKLFEDFDSASLDVLLKEYKAYKRFAASGSVRDFKEAVSYVRSLYNHFSKHIYESYPYSLSKLERLLREDPLFDQSAAPPSLQNLDAPLWKEVLSYLMCAYVPMDRYLVKRLIHPEHPQAVFYLFVPHSYLALRKVLTANVENGGLTDREWLCGLKIDHYPDVFPSQMDVQEAHCSNYYDAFVPMMQELFVKNKELEGRPPVNWVIYMLGHGNFSHNAYEQLHEQEKLLCHEERLLKKLQEECKRSFKLDIECKTLKEQEENVFKGRKRKAALRALNTIVGLPVDQFQAFLLFLNDSIKTRFFFYSTCSAGGEPFITTYTNPLTGLSYELNYAVLSDALAEAPSTSKSPSLHLSYYHNQFESVFWPIPFERLVDWKNAALTIDSPYQFSSFFAHAHACPLSAPALHSMLSSVSPVHKVQDFNAPSWRTFILGIWQKISALCKQLIRFVVGDVLRVDALSLERNEIKNIPSMRLPHEAHFRVIDLSNKFFVLQGSTTKNPKAEVIIPAADVLFLYCSDYPVLDIDVVNIPLFPAFVSMIPGSASHRFAAIRAAGYPFSEIAASFFCCPAINVTKIFFIKELTCVQDIFLKEVPYASLQTFRDVVFVNKKPSGLKEILDVQEEQSINEVSFSLGSYRYKASWNLIEPFPQAFCKLFDIVLDERKCQAYIQDLASKHFFCTIDAPLLTLESASVCLNNCL